MLRYNNPEKDYVFKTVLRNAVAKAIDESLDFNNNCQEDDEPIFDVSLRQMLNTIDDPELEIKLAKKLFDIEYQKVREDIISVGKTTYYFDQYGARLEQMGWSVTPFCDGHSTDIRWSDSPFVFSIEEPYGSRYFCIYGSVWIESCYTCSGIGKICVSDSFYKDFIRHWEWAKQRYGEKFWLKR